MEDDIDMLKAIRHSHPSCSLILDANEGYKASEALDVLEQLHGNPYNACMLIIFDTGTDGTVASGAELQLTPILFEQPVVRDDWQGLLQVTTEAYDRYGVLVAADESCRSMEDVTRIVQHKLAHVVNIKLCKMGILVSLEVLAPNPSLNVCYCTGTVTRKSYHYSLRKYSRFMTSLYVLLCVDGISIVS